MNEKIYKIHSIKYIPVNMFMNEKIHSLKFISVAWLFIKRPVPSSSGYYTYRQRKGWIHFRAAMNPYWRLPFKTVEAMTCRAMKSHETPFQFSIRFLSYININNLA